MTDADIIEIRKKSRATDPVMPWGDTLAFARALMDHVSKIEQPAPATAALPKQPPPGLLMSMAMRYDHGLGCKAYYDEIALGPPAGGQTHAQRLESTLVTMRQLYEEVSGHGFYRPELEAAYVASCAEGLVQPGSAA